MAVFTVTNFNDAGAGSLRQAIIDANGAAGADTIDFTAGLAGGTIVLTSGDLVISSDIDIDGDINGDNAADITVSGNNASRVFTLTSGVSVLDALTISNGFSNSYTTGYGGGGARVESGANLTVLNSTFSDNVGNNGGGLLSNGGTITVINSTFTGNQAGNNGAGISIRGSGSATIANSTFSGNTAGDHGGGLYIGTYDNATLSNVTITGNDAQYGGGIFAFTNYYSGTYGTYTGTLDISNSILAGNYASGNGANPGETTFRQHMLDM